jgi:uncharacterized metal-binding protein
MVDLPKKKVGIVACSGEDLPEGTVTRLAALNVLEKLRPADTVTICLPLFLAGGEGDRAFARFYPTIAVDGCELRCAARGTEMYSGKPAASVVVTEVMEEAGLEAPVGCRRLDGAGLMAVEATAERIADLVDELLDKRWSRKTGQFVVSGIEPEIPPDEMVLLKEAPASCACGSGIPVKKIAVDGKVVPLVGLPLIFEQFKNQGKAPEDSAAAEILEMIKIYNPVPAGEDENYARSLLAAYADYWKEEEDR